MTMPEPGPPPLPQPTTSGVLLVADDYAMTNGISRAIVDLAEAGRLSATSAMTTSAHWPSHATWIARVRNRVAVGLHLNLTLGRPLGPTPRLAPGGRFPALGDLLPQATGRRLDPGEITAEIERQLIAFEAEIGLPPDHVDGHQHVHALPTVRDCLLDVLTRRYGHARPRPLVRDPADQFSRITARRRGAVKALTLAWLSRGFGTLVRAHGFPTNEGFAGVGDFAVRGVAADFAAAVAAPGPRQLIMCHPGFVDDELARLDPVTVRRRAEHDALLTDGLPAPIWRPNRTAVGDPIDWSLAWTGTAAALAEDRARR